MANIHAVRKPQVNKFHASSSGRTCIKSELLQFLLSDVSIKKCSSSASPSLLVQYAVLN